MQGLTRNIYEQQSHNRRNTVIVMAVFLCFLAFLGYGFDTAMGFFPFGTMVALAGGSMAAVWSLQSGAQTVLSSAGAQRVPPEDVRYAQLRNVNEEMAIAAGVPPPALYIIDDPDPNAFATGRDPRHASVAVTQGLLESLNRDELQAVVAHEMSHIRNYDIRLMTVVAALVGAIMLISEFAVRSMRLGAVKGKGGGGSRRGGSAGGPLGLVILVLWILSIILAPVIAKILAMTVSRQREYLADASAAELTRNPGALASALEKLDRAVEPTKSIKKGTAHMCIVDPINHALNDKEGMVANLFATHPPIKKRVTLLRAMAFQYRPNPSLQSS
jgi:heat shock protein HtpX